MSDGNYSANEKEHHIKYGGIAELEEDKEFLKSHYTVKTNNVGLLLR